MQLTIQHWLVLVIPVFIAFATFFVAEEYALRKGNNKEYIWKPMKLNVEIAMIIVVGSLIATAAGYLSYMVIFHVYLF